jgi:hypothetical protein
MRKVKTLQGLHDISTYRNWKITFPSMTKKYMYSGSKADAVAKANAIGKSAKWPYSPKIREIKI